MEYNPIFSKHDKDVMFGDKMLRQISHKELEQNAIIVPLGKSPAMQMFGYHPTEAILYILENENDHELFRNVLTGKINETIPFFKLHRPIGGRGTIEMFWKLKLTKLLAGAVQYHFIDDKMIITHMVVKAKFRRNKLNTHMINFLIEYYKIDPKNIYFHELTDMGRKFMKVYGGSEYKR